METAKLIQFGDKWVKVKDNVYYLSKHEIKALKIWYSFSTEYDVEMSEEERADAIELFAKALKLLNPKDEKEASIYITKLEHFYEEAPTTIKDIINRIYTNKMRTEREDEM